MFLKEIKMANKEWIDANLSRSRLSALSFKLRNNISWRFIQMMKEVMIIFSGKTDLTKMRQAADGSRPLDVWRFSWRNL